MFPDKVRQEVLDWLRVSLVSVVRVAGWIIVQTNLKTGRYSLQSAVRSSSHIGQVWIFKGWQSPYITSSYSPFSIVNEGVGEELLRGKLFDLFN